MYPTQLCLFLIMLPGAKQTVAVFDVADSNGIIVEWAAVTFSQFVVTGSVCKCLRRLFIENN